MGNRIFLILSLLSLALILISACTTSEGSLFETVIAADDTSDDGEQDSENGEDSEDGEDTLDGDDEEDSEDEKVPSVGISVTSEPDDAEVYVDGDFVGRTPITFVPEGGSHQIRVARPGFRSASYWLTYEKGTLTELHVELIEITGFLSVQVEPPDAELYLGGSRIEPGLRKLRVGTYRLDARAFGYEPFGRYVTIYEDSVTTASPVLEEAEFEVERFSISRGVLNPYNPGRLGEVLVNIGVTSWGSGTVTVQDESGDTVRRLGKLDFEAWDYSVVWDGRNEDGEIVDDGRYAVVLEAEGRREGRRASEIEEISIDSTSRIVYRSLWSGITGMLYVPSPEVISLSSYQLGVLIGGHFNPSLGTARFPMQAGIRIPLDFGAEVAVQGTVIVDSETDNPFSLGAGFMYPLTGGSPADTVTLGVYGKGTWLNGTTADTQTNFTGIHAGLSTQLRLGPILVLAAAELTASPFDVVYRSAGSDPGFYAWGYGRGGIMLDTGSIVAGVSGAIRTVPFNRGFGIRLPVAVGAELHWLLPGTYVVASGIVFAEANSVNDYYISGGGGLGILY